MQEDTQTIKTKNQFGAFAGVFTPSILTILGVIMFMRAGFVIGQGGIIGALIILFIANMITFLTTLSISAISTNTQVQGGGAYFLISRSLGPEFGGAIGLALFLAVALSVPFYILGFTEAVVRTFPSISENFQIIALITAGTMFIIAYVGASYAIKTQYIIMAILGISILIFMGGAALQFSKEIFSANLFSDYTPVNPEFSKSGLYSFWIIFAIYFPAVTGIDAGVNMSGDLKNPDKSIPIGSIFAVITGFLIYATQIVICGGAFSRKELIETPFTVLVNNALFGLGFLVIAGVWAATLSSALGSFLGAPRVLQSLARDPILLLLKPFAKGTLQGDEPKRALILVGIMTYGVILWAGNKSEGAALNIIAAIITMFFLYSYGMINFSAFIEAFSKNPSFRPRFRFFHWTTGIIGTLACLYVSFKINWMAAFAAIIIIILVYWYIKTKNLSVAFGDARMGFIYTAARKNLFQLARMESNPKNWRPTILVFSGNPNERSVLVHYSSLLESEKGILLIGDILIGTIKEYGPRLQTRNKQLLDFCSLQKVQAFPQVLVSENLDSGISVLLQTASIGPIRPNMVLFGFPSDNIRKPFIIEHCRTASLLGMSIILMSDKGMPNRNRNKRIDVWWRGKKNGALMLLLAHLLTQNYRWESASIRIIRLVKNEEGVNSTKNALSEMINKARIKAIPHVIVNDAPFSEIIKINSADATCIILGFEIPEKGSEIEFFATYESFLSELPTTLIVNSIGKADIFA